ncbi:MAG TPA: hypothetical protein VG477_05390 [Thermoanaerobaculia bacterium]|nr:hypothetical protein [Thermoanaerobaculia bacterium]
MNNAALKYSWLTYRRDQLWFPLAFLALFIVILLILRHPVPRFSIARAYLGFIVPLTGGILAAYSVLDDPALELRFSTPVRAEQTLLARLGLILAVQAVCALVFQIFVAALGIDLSPLGGLFKVQLVWFLPTLALAALGTAGSLAGAQTSIGAFLAGAAWLIHLLMNSWLRLNARPVFLFLGVIVPGDPKLALNQFVLFAGSMALLLISWALLRRQERYL